MRRHYASAAASTTLSAGVNGSATSLVVASVPVQWIAFTP
jgi:hypothetical protein